MFRTSAKFLQDKLEYKRIFFLNKGYIDIKYFESNHTLTENTYKLSSGVSETSSKNNNHFLIAFFLKFA